MKSKPQQRRWRTPSSRRSPAFLNTDGGTLLDRRRPDRSVVGLDHDYAQVKPQNGDGFVNWLTTHLIERAGSTQR